MVHTKNVAAKIERQLHWSGRLAKWRLLALLIHLCLRARLVLLYIDVLTERSNQVVIALCVDNDLSLVDGCTYQGGGKLQMAHR